MREKELVRLMPKFYRWSIYNASMFFFVKGQFMLIPTMTLDQAISNYYRFTDITEDEWDRMSIRTTYTRMQQEFYNDLKSECAKTDKRDTGEKTGSDKQEH